jgi:hypothetical protein
MFISLFINMIILGSPYQIQVKDTNGKVILSGLEQTLLTNSPCIIEGRLTHFVLYKIHSHKT